MPLFLQFLPLTKTYRVLTEANYTDKRRSRTALVLVQETELVPTLLQWKRTCLYPPRLLTRAASSDPTCEQKSVATCTKTSATFNNHKQRVTNYQSWLIVDWTKIAYHLHVKMGWDSAKAKLKNNIIKAVVSYRGYECESACDHCLSMGGPQSLACSKMAWRPQPRSVQSYIPRIMRMFLMFVL